MSSLVDIPFVFTAVYASNDLDERCYLWTSLHDTYLFFGLDCAMTWILCGDTNEILESFETLRPFFLFYQIADERVWRLFRKPWSV